MLGFQQFTSFFTSKFLWKAANVIMQLSVAICAYKNAFFNFTFHSLPAAGQTRLGNAKFFFEESA